MDKYDIRIASDSDVGRQRAGNEDSYRVVAPTDLPENVDAIFVVADGMGGHAAGEVASQITVDSVIATLTSAVAFDIEDADLLNALKSAVLTANSEVIAEGVSSPEKRGMGTTCTLGLVRGGLLHIAHIGDSRGYLLSDRVLGRITNDHSLVEEEVRKGLLTPEEAWYDPRSNIITRAIGLDENPEVDTVSVALKAGDRVMFCSDGLNSMIQDPEIESIMNQGDAGDAVRSLIDAANEAGGSDNVTVVVADVVSQ